MKKAAKKLFSDTLKLVREEEWNEAQRKIFELSRMIDDEILDQCVELCTVGDEDERWLAANVLGENGIRDGANADRRKAIAQLKKMLKDKDEDVISIAVRGLGNLDAEGALGNLKSLEHHESQQVRHALAHALGGCQSDKAIRMLIRLSRDDDGDVRDWATFGLGAQTDRNTKAIREALLARINDPHDDTKQEAVWGLANRKVQEIIPAMIDEMRYNVPSTFALEAAKNLAAPELIPVLNDILDQYDDVRAALDACLAAKDEN